MFNRILGTLTGRSNDSIYVLTGGIEWDISVPSRTLRLFGESGSEVEVFVWLHHYEDGMRLFGFPSAHERSLFLELTKVEGIGPRQALKILSGISPEELTRALDTQDLAALKSIPGVGPKLAQKMVLALKGKLVESGEDLPAGGTKSAFSDVVNSLADMGFDRKAAEAAVKLHGAGQIPNPESEKDVFRKALLELSTKGGSR